MKSYIGLIRDKSNVAVTHREFKVEVPFLRPVVEPLTRPGPRPRQEFLLSHWPVCRIRSPDRHIAAPYLALDEKFNSIA